MARCAAFVFVLLSAASAAAQVRDPYLTWRTIETPRFAVHYHEPLGVMARKVAVAAEQAHARLAPILKHTPTTRTHIVLSDNTDDANGLASVLPYNTMRLYASAPEDLSALDDYDDWMVTLVTHEYTHILHLDTIAGIPAVLNAVLGKTFSTNNNQPRWFIEGLAVDEESLQTSAGRERSAVFDMYMRMDALEGRLLRLDQVSNSVDRWPWGNVPYIYGSRFMRFIAETHGREALTAISHDYGEDLIPYALNRTAKRATGKTYVELYADFRAELEEKSRALVARIEREGRVEGRRLTTEGEYARSPRFLPDGRIAYWSSDGNTFSEIRAVPWSGHGHDRLVRANGPGSLGVRSDGTLVFSGANAHRDLYFFNDLHLYSERDDRTTRLSDGLRAREPDVSPDDSRVAFTVNGAGTTHLAVAPLNEPSQRRLLVRSPRFGQVYTPRWSPDGTRIAFSAWEKGGFRDIRIVDVRTGAVTDVTRDRAMDTGPAWSPDGRTLYFSSDRSGVFNIYAFELGSRVLRRVTHVVAGAFQPDVSRDGKRLTYLGYSSRGFDVFALDLDPA
ncbi:MAG: PD40 domain-containing protein, partial [Myxococcales bacterium]|nr:PD40 domain-containing protein [Myxococcales bacterium]